MAIKGQKFRLFSPEYKRQAVEMYLSGASKKGITRELGLSNSSYIRRWINTYEKYGCEGLNDQRGRNKQGAINLGKKNSRKPELKIKWLEAEIALLKKIAAWEWMCARKRLSSLLSET